MQGTGVAVESQGFTIITSGRRKELAPIKGRATLQNPNYRHLAPIRKTFGEGILESLETRVSASQNKRFPLIDFIDTPGLVDGNTEYPFPVNDVISFFAEHADLILIFLDPHGQALGKRTMDVVKALNNDHYEKMRYFLTKADTIGKASDLTKVICQITQNLCAHIKNTHGFNVPAIYIPQNGSSANGGAGRGGGGDGGDDDDDELTGGAAGSFAGRVNNLGQLCRDIEKTINQKVQDNLNKLKDDADAVVAKVAALLQDDAVAQRKRRRRRCAGCALSLVAWALPCVLFLCMAAAYKSQLPGALTAHAPVASTLDAVAALNERYQVSPADLSGVGKWAATTFAAFCLASFAHYRARAYTVLGAKRAAKLGEYANVSRKLLARHKELYASYFESMQGNE